MKHYQVYGLGNALVDVEYQVSDEFLQQHRIDKGVMTLVEQQQQLATLAALQAQYELKKRCAGGSATNTVYALQQFGGQGFYSCKVADDAAGAFYLEDLHGSGVKTNHTADSNEDITGQCVVMVSEDAERTMHTYLGITATLDSSVIDAQAIADSEYLYIEGYLVTSASAMQAVAEAKRIAKQQGVKIAFTFSDPAMVQFFKPAMQEIIGDGLDLIFCNEAEAMAFFDCSDLDSAIEAMKAVADSFVITLGKQGAIIYDQQQLIKVCAPAVTALDTNGAGDLFAGSYLYGLTHGWTPQKSGQLAVTACAHLVQAFGARLPAESYQQIIAELD